MKTLNDLFNESDIKPRKITREQFNEAVENLIEDKFNKNDEMYLSYIQLMLQRDKMETCYDLDFYEFERDGELGYFFRVNIDCKIR